MRRRRLKQNPSAADIERAERDFRRFHWGDGPVENQRRRVPDVAPGDQLFGLGDLVEVVYETHKDGRIFNWVHDFKSPRPVLASTLDGELVIIGGSYRVTGRGIVG